MKKSIVIGITFLSIFLLCSISYQPIIADEPIIEPEHILIEEYSIIEEDCPCEENNDWDFPLICWILERLWYIIPQFSPFPVPLMHWVIIIIAEMLGCPNIPP
jgi:hypothetical protein